MFIEEKFFKCYKINCSFFFYLTMKYNSHKDIKYLMVVIVEKIKIKRRLLFCCSLHIYFVKLKRTQYDITMRTLHTVVLPEQGTYVLQYILGIIIHLLFSEHL